MSRSVIPKEYIGITWPLNNGTRFWYFGSIAGSKVPFRSRGVFTAISWFSVRTVFPLYPFRQPPDDNGLSPVFRAVEHLDGGIKGIKVGMNEIGHIPSIPYPSRNR
jgi:hypothetical protein